MLFNTTKLYDFEISLNKLSLCKQENCQNILRDLENFDSKYKKKQLYVSDKFITEITKRRLILKDSLE